MFKHFLNIIYINGYHGSNSSSFISYLRVISSTNLICIKYRIEITLNKY